MTKKELRQWGLRKMRALPQEVVVERSEAVVRNLAKLPEFVEARGVFTCLSFKNEVNVWPLVEELTSGGAKEVYVPRAERGDVALHVHRYPCAMRTLKIGLQQPLPGEPELDASEIGKRIDIGLILGVLYERDHGFRLGYGGGYFDRFLEKGVFTSVGLAFEDQMLDSLPVEPHDVALDIIVTEEKVYRFGGT